MDKVVTKINSRIYFITHLIYFKLMKSYMNSSIDERLTLAKCMFKKNNIFSGRNVIGNANSILFVVVLHCSR